MTDTPKRNRAEPKARLSPAALRRRQARAARQAGDGIATEAPPPTAETLAAQQAPSTGLAPIEPGFGRDGAGASTNGSGRGGLARTFHSYWDLRNTPYGLTPAIVLGLIAFFQQFDTVAFSVAAPDIAADLEISIPTIIGILTIVGIFAVFGSIAVGYFADRTRRVPYISIGTFISGVFSIVASRAGSATSLGVPRVIDDVADEVSTVPRFALLADYYPTDARGRMIAFVATLSRIGRVLALVIVGALIVTIGWRATLAAAGVPLIVLGVISLLVLREPVRGYFERKAFGADEEVASRAGEPMSMGESWRATFGIRTIRRIVIANGIGEVGDRMVGLFLPFFLAEVYGLNAFERSLIVLPSVLTALVGGIYGGVLIDRFTRRNPARVLTLIAIYAMVAAVGVVLFIFEPPLLLLVLATAIFSFGAALIGPARFVVIANVIPPSIRVTGINITNIAFLPSLIFAGTIGGLVFSEYGYSAVWMVAIPFLVLSALVLFTVAPFYDLDMRSAFAAAMADEEWRRAKASGKGKLLVCRDVEVEYSGVKVLFGVDFDVEEGEIIALLGTNGAGKSTLLRAISGLTQASSGAVVFDGRDITAMPANETAARGIVFMPGGRGIFPALSVRDNLLLATWLAKDPDQAKEVFDEVVELFPVLKERADTPAGALSGGEQQQLSLAQALLEKPRLLMIDELSLGLSPAVIAELIEKVKQIHERGVTIIVVEQSVNVALTLAERAIFMEKGEVKFFGRTADLLARPDILRAVYVKGTGALTDGAPAGARRSERDQRALELGESRPVLEVEGLVKRYGGVTAVDGVSLDLREGEVLGLIGPNGAGKTTIFDLISGFQVPDAGVVRYEGVDITGLSPDERARRRLVRRFQDARLFPSLTVFETLLVALEQRLEVKSSLLSAVAAPQSRKAERRVRARAERLVELFELGAYQDKFVKELSTGLRRILDLACVLATEPKVLLLDEPSSGIAQAEAEGLAPLLRRVRFETGCSILIIEHDMPLISSVSDELVALDRGKVVVRGRPDEVLNDERVIEAYLGTSEAAIRRSGSVTP